MQKTSINQIFQIFSSENSHPKTELEYTNNFTLLVAVVLSAQATDKSVNKATKSLFEIAKEPKEIIILGEENLKKYIRTIGLFNSKAKNIINLSKILHNKFNGEVPNNFDELKSLPGVGAKTANVILNCAFGEPTIAVDTHVFRVSKRIGIASENTPDKVQIELEKNIPDIWKTHAHHWLILHGRYICTARNAKCTSCKINEFCKLYKNGSAIKLYME